MSPTETVTVLRQLMNWLRDKSNWPPSPMQIEKAIAAAIEHLESDAESLAMHRKVRDERDELRAENAALVDDMNLLRNNNTALRAKITEMERQEPVGCVESLFDDVVIIHNDFDRAAPVYLAPGAQPAPSIPVEAIGKMLADVMAVAVSNGANSVSMPDEYVEVAVWLQGECPTQPAPSVPEGVLPERPA